MSIFPSNEPYIDPKFVNFKRNSILIEFSYFVVICKLLDDEDNIFQLDGQKDDADCWESLMQKCENLSRYLPLDGDLKWAASNYGSGMQFIHSCLETWKRNA